MACVSDLKYSCEGEALYVRALRKWIAYNKSEETWFLTVDRHGDAIQILGSKDGQQYIEDKLKIGCCYKIVDYTCTETTPYADVIKNKIHLNAGPASKITQVTCEDDFPTSWFRFISLSEMSSIADKMDEYADVIGYFKDAKECKKKEDEKFVRLIITTESGDEISVALWKECSQTFENFDPSILSVQPSNTVIAITSVKVTTYSGKPSFASSYATHVYVDPPSPYTDHLKL